MKTRIILNGKKAGLKSVRDAISETRRQSPSLEVRTTYESGDVERLVNEAIAEGVERIIAGGGDGTVNEVADALVKLPVGPELAIMPLGTANDFATACNIPRDPLAALSLAINGKSTPIDIGKANERHFVNVASGGFGAEVTVDTPVELKNFLGGGAYTLTGLVKAMNFAPYRGKFVTHEGEVSGAAIVGAVCNGRQAGGGQVLAPNAFINDGLLDVLIVKDFSARDLPRVVDEILNPSPEGEFVMLFQTQWVEMSAYDKIAPVNLDGEPYRSKVIRFEVLPGAIELVLPEYCPLLKEAD
jgi:lipid kinase YegS